MTPSRPLRAALALSLIALASCDSGRSELVEVTEELPLLATLDRIPGDGTAVLAALGEPRGSAALLAPGEELRFGDLLLPEGARLELELRAVAGDGGHPDTLRIRLEVRGTAGDPVVGVHEVALAGEPGRFWFPFTTPLDVPGGARELVLAFEPVTEEPAGVALLRPRVVFPRTVPRAHRGARRVLLFTLDTLRADALGCYGNEEPTSPRLDELASQGFRFEHAFATTNVTNPSHASIFTSLHLKDHSVKDNFTRFDPAVPNLVTALRERGFHTAAFVASHNFRPGVTGFDELFDEFFASPDLQRRAVDVNAELLPWLTEHRDRDLFAWVHYYDAHAPYEPPFPFSTLFRHGAAAEHPTKLDRPPTWHEVRRNRALARSQYLGEVAALDREVGRVLDHLEALGALEETLVVVTSDHGESLGEHGIECSHQGVYEVTTRVPLILRLPGRDAAVVHELASTLDIWPTLFDALGFGVPPGLRGRSLLQVLSGDAAPREGVFSESAYGRQLTVRTPRQRAILGVEDALLGERTFRAGELELFETDTDPRERRDLADSRPDRAEALRRWLSDFPSDGLALGAEGIADEAFADEMRALGYTE